MGGQRTASMCALTLTASSGGGLLTGAVVAASAAALETALGAAIVRRRGVRKLGEKAPYETSHSAPVHARRNHHAPL